eukprot:c33887_g1_i1.p1 GENE.c33887_g1_i1~~c33887_g1_i1.p1  ORF type:complete len:309 (+),score=120.78 c33887_g1_i1:136-927(+)
MMGLTAFEDPPDLILLAMETETETESIFSFQESEIASHLMYFEHNLFRCITPNEFLRGAWTGQDKNQKAKNIIDMIDHFNKVSNWVSMLILNEQKLESRRQIINDLISLGECCQQIQNFNAIKEIVSGLFNPAISRLKVTWQGISTSKMNKLKALQKLVGEDKGYEMLRVKLSEVQPPCMPFLGIYLQDLSAADEGYPDYVDGKINFEKCKKIAHISLEVITFQKVVPELKSPNMSLLKLLATIPPSPNDLTIALSLSRKLEP